MHWVSALALLQGAFYGRADVAGCGTDMQGLCDGATDELELLQRSTSGREDVLLRQGSGQTQQSLQQQWPWSPTNDCTAVKHALVMEGSGGKGFMPFFSTMSLDKPTSSSRKITTVVIWAQPFSGSAFQQSDTKATLCHVVNEVVRPHDMQDETLVIAPWFAEERVGLKSEQWAKDGPKNLNMLWWESPTTYTSGKDDEAFGISAFAVLDNFVSFLQEDAARAFPNLERISVVGYSGGGKLLTRWSILSDVLVAGAGRAKVTVTAGAANSYLYLDARRPEQACNPMSSKQVAKCDSFEVPKSTHGCSDYDHWPYGLAHVPSTGYSYVHPVTKDANLLKKKLATLPGKSILTLVGSKDFCNCNDADEGFDNDGSCYHPSPFVCSDCYPDTPWGLPVGIVGGSCKKKFAGNNRRQRLTNYMQYLSYYFRHEFGVEYQPTYALFPGAHHREHFWESSEFASMVLGKQS
jgi:hypothetical protein